MKPKVIDPYKMIVKRTEEVDGEKDWLWIKGDRYAFSAPASDWPVLRDLVLANVRSRGTIIQAGGLMGMYPRLWAKYFDVVYTFEPNAFNFFLLTQNCRSESIVKIQAALGSRVGVVKSTNIRYGNMGLCKVANGGIVPLLRIDDFDVGCVDAIQLDCEGSEPEIIQGALRTIGRYKPVVVCESVSGRMHSSMETLGYRKTLKHGMDTIFVYEF